MGSARDDAVRAAERIAALRALVTWSVERWLRQSRQPSRLRGSTRLLSIPEILEQLFHKEPELSCATSPTA